MVLKAQCPEAVEFRKDSNDESGKTGKEVRCIMTLTREGEVG